MSTFSTSAALPSPNCEALRAAIVALTNSGFAIDNLDEHSAVLSGPGLKYTRQNPLLGASKICIAVDRHHLRLDAELGGADSMQRFVSRFPMLLGLGLASVIVAVGLVLGWRFGVGFGVPGVQGWLWMLICCGPLLSVAPWLFLSPMMSRMIRASTRRALTTLISNSVQLSKVA